MSRTPIVFVVLLSIVAAAVGISWTHYADEERRRGHLTDDKLSPNEILALHSAVGAWLAEVEPRRGMQDATTFDRCYERVRQTRELTQACEVNRFSSVALTNLISRPNNGIPCDIPLSNEIERLYSEYKVECSQYLNWPEERIIDFQVANDIDHQCYRERVVTIATYIELYSKTRRRLLGEHRIESTLFRHLIGINEGRRFFRLAIGDRSAANSVALVQYADEWAANGGSAGPDEIGRASCRERV